ncbi:MAG: hypothetical protein O8C67_10085 [Candidatus Methanoperedens sp.]|nr:hypothetical protein [Candidatus Methanoperedens sp.]
MNLPILKLEDATVDDFIKTWRKFYVSDENKDMIYFTNLNPINKLTEDNIQNLFLWKNGMRLSDKKQESLNNLKNKLSEIQKKISKYGNSNNELEEIYNYSFEFFENGYIWNLFFLHILKYEKCPIADIYAYRAYNYIRNGENELPVYNWETYLKYMDFFNEIATITNRITKEEKKEIDEALWGFGKFLENYPRIIINTID